MDINPIFGIDQCRRESPPLETMHRNQMGQWIMYRKLITGLIAGMALTAPAYANKGDILIRLRGIMVAPNTRSGGILPTLPAEQVKVSKSFMPEVDFSYMLTNHVGAELIVATTKHHADGKTGTTGAIGRLASTWVLPPTLTLQYHFAPQGSIRPYVGAGINYSIFYSEKASTALVTAVGPTKVGMSDSVGYALQAGVDIPIGKRTFVNLDIKYLDIDTTARLATTAIGTQSVKIHLDPVVVGVGFGMRF
jgi:outer membrane protein